MVSKGLNLFVPGDMAGGLRKTLYAKNAVRLWTLGGGFILDHHRGKPRDDVVAGAAIPKCASDVSGYCFGHLDDGSAYASNARVFQSRVPKQFH